MADKKKDSNSFSLQSDPTVSGSNLRRSGLLRGRIGQPYQCVYGLIKNIHIPSFMAEPEALPEKGTKKSIDFTPEEDPDEERWGLGETPHGPVPDPVDVHNNSLQISKPDSSSTTDEERAQMRRRVEFLDDEESGKLTPLVEHKNCGSEYAHIDPHTGVWTSACADGANHASTIPKIEEAVFNFLRFFRTPPQYDRTDRLRGQNYELQVQEPAKRQVLRTVREQREILKERRQRTKGLKPGEEPIIPFEEESD